MTLAPIILTGDGDSTQEVTVDNYKKELWLCTAGNKKSIQAINKRPQISIRSFWSLMSTENFDRKYSKPLSMYYRK